MDLLLGLSLARVPGCQPVSPCPGPCRPFYSQLFLPQCRVLALGSQNPGEDTHPVHLPLPTAGILCTDAVGLRLLEYVRGGLFPVSAVRVQLKALQEQTSLPLSLENALGPCSSGVHFLFILVTFHKLSSREGWEMSHYSDYRIGNRGWGMGQRSEGFQ